MQRVRKLCSVLLGVANCLWLALGLLSTIGSRDLVEHSIENGRAVAASFQQAALYVDAFSNAHSRLPSEAELIVGDPAFRRAHIPHTSFGFRQLISIVLQLPHSARHLPGHTYWWLLAPIGMSTMRLG